MFFVVYIQPEDKFNILKLENSDRRECGCFIFCNNNLKKILKYVMKIILHNSLDLFSSARFDDLST